MPDTGDTVVTERGRALLSWTACSRARRMEHVSVRTGSVWMAKEAGSVEAWMQAGSLDQDS